MAVVDRIQQYAFVAMYYGLDMGFDFDLCSHGGPASHEIADAVYRPSREDSGTYATAEPALPGSFRGGEFLEMVEGRSVDWLDAATTMLDANIWHRSSLEELRSTALHVTQCDPAVVDDAFNKLKKHGMFLVDGQP